MIVGLVIIIVIELLLCAGSFYFYVDEVKLNRRLENIVDLQRNKIYELEKRNPHSN